MEWEFTVLDFIAEYMHAKWLDWFMIGYTRLNDHGELWIAISILLLLMPKTRRIGLASSLSLIFMLFIGNIGLKPLIGRLRPFQIKEGIQLLIEAPGGYSFPSGHTFSSFASAAAIYAGNRRLGVGALLLAVLMAFSRLYLYVHFPTDILGGAVLGILCSMLAWWILQRSDERGTDFRKV